MRRLVLALALAPRLCAACPACASGQRAWSPLYLVLVILPFLAAGIAARAILRVLREGPH